MPLKTALARAGFFRPRDLSLISQVFREMELEGDADADRQARAATLIRLYQSGMETPSQLREAMGYRKRPEEKPELSADHGSSRRSRTHE